MSRDINGYNGFGRFPTYDIQSTSLAQGVAQSITVPSNFQNWLAIFSYTPGSNIWISTTGTAAAASTSFASGISMLNPSALQLSAGMVISCITADSTTPFVCIELQVITPYTAAIA